MLYTDGVAEAFNMREEEYGQTRLSVFLQTHALVPSSEPIPELVSDVLKFCGAARLTDDMTLMAIARGRKLNIAEQEKSAGQLKSSNRPTLTAQRQ